MTELTDLISRRLLSHYVGVPTRMGFGVAVAAMCVLAAAAAVLLVRAAEGFDCRIAAW